MLEHVDAEHDVVLVGVERDPLEIHDAVLVGARRAAALRLDHVDADDVARPRDLEALPAGLDVEDLERLSRGRIESRNRSASAHSTSPRPDRPPKAGEIRGPWLDKALLRGAHSGHGRYGAPRPLL
jgi:hypothetical protein